MVMQDLASAFGTGEMSYVGAPFEHDVFISYARAERETGSELLLRWNLNFADQIIQRLKTAAGPEIDVFIDRDGMQSGQELPGALRQAVEKSAFLLVLMSSFYPKSRWCCEELEYHFSKSKQDGRTGHCVVVRAQPLPDADWPNRLKDDRGGPVFYRDLADIDENLPFGVDDFAEQRLKDGIRQVHIELYQRIREYRKQLEARRTLDASRQAPPLKPVIYLHGRSQDLDSWARACETLAPKAIVHPPSLSSAEDVLAVDGRKKKLQEYAACNGLAILRTSSSDIDLDLMMMYRDRQRLYQEHHIDLPWAVVDAVGDEWPVAKNYRAPQVMTSDPAWPDRLLETLFPQ